MGKKKTTNLQTVSNYAKKNNLSATYVYKMLKDGKLECEEIDGVKFVKLKK